MKRMLLAGDFPGTTEKRKAFTRVNDRSVRMIEAESIAGPDTRFLKKTKVSLSRIPRLLSRDFPEIMDQFHRQTDPLDPQQG